MRRSWRLPAFPLALRARHRVLRARHRVLRARHRVLDARHRVLGVRLTVLGALLPTLGALLLVVAGAGVLVADGGTLRVGNLPMGAYRVNVFTDPTPIGPDSIDVSVLVTYERGRGVAQGLEIEVEGERADSAGIVVRHSATQDQADDPRYYAAKFALGSEGLWTITVRLSGPEGEGETSFQVKVQKPGLFGNPFLILTMALLPLLLVGMWLKRS